MDEMRRLWREAVARVATTFGSRRDRRTADDGDDQAFERSVTGRGRALGFQDVGLDGDSVAVVATAEDDAASVVGRIDIAEAPSVLLIVRRDARALSRATAWPHIAAYVRQRGIDLAVVSARGDVRAHARANGLRAARTPGALRPRSIYIRSLDRTVTLPRMPWDRVVRGGMIVVALGTIGIVGCYRLPSAVVTIVPDSDVITVAGTARPNALVDSSDVEGGTILVSTVRRQVFTVVTTETTGETEVGDESATLEVTFENASASLEQVSRLTELRTEDGVVFLTDANLDIPAGATATVSATAALPGEPGNVEAGAIVQVGPGVAPGITIVGSTAGSGGTNRLTAAVSQEDVDRARAIASDILERVAIGTLTQIVDEEERGTLIPASVSAAIFSEVPVQRLEEPSDIFIVEYAITASGMVVSEAQATAYGDLLIRSELPQGLTILPGSVVTTVTPLDDDGRVRIDATARTAGLAEIEEVAARIPGMRLGPASELLERELGLGESPRIEIRPNFIPWLWLPRREANIDLIIAGPSEPLEAPGIQAGSDATPDPDTTPDPDATSAPAEEPGDDDE